jgi:hypothetical protein
MERSDFCALARSAAERIANSSASTSACVTHVWQPYEPAPTHVGRPLRAARHLAGVVPDQDLNARMSALGSAKPSSAAISPTRRSLSNRLCAASNRTSSARPEKVTLNASSRWASVRVKTESAADAIAR